MFEDEAECSVKPKMCCCGSSILSMDAKGSFSIPEADHYQFLEVSVT